MSDAAVPHDQHQLGALHALSRRQALMTLAALPAALVRPVTTARMSLSGAGGPELFLARCAASLAVLLASARGSDLPAVEQLLVGVPAAFGGSSATGLARISRGRPAGHPGAPRLRNPRAAPEPAAACASTTASGPCSTRASHLMPAAMRQH